MLDLTDAPVPVRCEICGLSARYFFTLDDQPSTKNHHHVCSKKCGMIVFERYFDKSVDKINEQLEHDGHTVICADDVPDISEVMKRISKQMGRE